MFSLSSSMCASPSVISRFQHGTLVERRVSPHPAMAGDDLKTTAGERPDDDRVRLVKPALLHQLRQPGNRFLAFVQTGIMRVRVQLRDFDNFRHREVPLSACRRRTTVLVHLDQNSRTASAARRSTHKAESGAAGREACDGRCPKNFWSISSGSARFPRITIAEAEPHAKRVLITAGKVAHLSLGPSPRAVEGRLSAVRGRCRCRSNNAQSPAQTVQ